MWYRIVLVCLIMSYAAGAEENQPKGVGWPLLQAYIPTGFDDNDKVQVTVTGEFPNTCFRVGSYTSSVDPVAQTIHVGSVANSYLGICLPMLIPFTQVIDVGLVPPGNYKVLDIESEKELGKISITRSKTPGPDDFLYLAVEDAYVQKTSSEPSGMLAIEGHIMHRCSKLDRVEIHYYPDTIVVQPIVTFQSGATEEKCAAGMSRVRYMEKLKPGLKGAYLLHVRSLNGQAVNKIVAVN